MTDYYMPGRINLKVYMLEYGKDCLEMHVEVTHAHSTMFDSQDIINRDQ
ncbi:hypothetical protein GCM10010129_83580 [Streptomyces fumigatiscleroticus]|nr:hypothetical protein GCM10010129_83580 [Streptomyces fumigatiscleroticus]